MAQINKLVILGLGLIGGSLALAAKRAGSVGHVAAWGRRASSLEQGLALGVIDSYSLDMAQALQDADVVVVATPTQTAEQVMVQVLQQVPSSCVVTDVASVKGNLLAAARAAFGQEPPNLVLGHPIAGSEQNGVAAAKADLFVNHRVILTPSEHTDAAALASITALWQQTGAEVVHMPVAEHDAVLAATSHLPHVLAYALVDDLAMGPRSAEIFRFAAGGFRDFTRIASSHPQMWAEISLANSAAIVAAIEDFEKALGRLKQAINTADQDTVHATFARAKLARDEFAALLAQRQSGAD